MNHRAERAVFLAAFDQCARTALAASWTGSWCELVLGNRRFESPRSGLPGWPDDTPVACLADWRAGYELSNRASDLARTLGAKSRPWHDSLLETNKALRLTVVVASSHGEAHPVSAFAEHEIGKILDFPDGVAEAILCDGLLAAFLNGLGTTWPGVTLSAACASACVATGLAAARIRAGLCDACLVVALDVLSRVAHAGFRQIGAMSATGCRPFDRSRDGTTIGEAGAVMLLVGSGVRLPSSWHCKAEVLGFGQSCNARHPVEPSAEGIVDSIQRALGEARQDAADLAAVYWHGTGTVQNDRSEAEAADKLFGANAPIGTSTKGAFGHAMGASAALSILAAAETTRTRVIPPVAGLNESEFPHMRLVQGKATSVSSGPIAVVALGFGGINAALVLGPITPAGE